jgi:uridine phosphorylase
VDTWGPHSTVRRGCDTIKAHEGEHEEDVSNRVRVRADPLWPRRVSSGSNLLVVDVAGIDVPNELNRRSHWDRVYAKGERDVSWYETVPAISIQMMEAAGVGPDTCVVDIGGGDSRLIDQLVARGLDCLAVLDVSAAALHRAQARLGASASVPRWIEADVTAEWSLDRMDIWHDRAVFHFLTEPADRTRYVEHLRNTLTPTGSAIIATFAEDGPEQCSGLPVRRYSPHSLATELGPEFVLREARPHQHVTPWGTAQSFQYSRFTRAGQDAPIVSRKDVSAPSLFSPLTVLTEAKRQKELAAIRVPTLCVLDPDGDIVRWLKRTGRGTLSNTWACYHSELHEFDVAETRVGIVGCAVGAPYAVLVAEQMFACGCEFLISITSAGQIAKVATPPYFVLIARALRDEGTSYHYQTASRFAEADVALLSSARIALQAAGIQTVEGSTWTTDAPFRETAAAVAQAEHEGLLAVEMESAALYAFAAAKRKRVLCLAHVTNTMGHGESEFEKGSDHGATASLQVIETLVLHHLGRKRQIRS